MTKRDDDGLLARLRTFVQPDEDGLPNRHVLWWPLAALTLVLIGFVALGITGSSTGVLHELVSTGEDPDLIAGSPQPVRSDEWYVQTSWTISQVEQGLPVRNESFPGGMDATVQHDLPSSDWSMVFRPHLLGFLFLPLDNAMALKWWLPGFALVGALYFLGVTLLPRRPVTAGFIAVSAYLAPFFQWWYLSITFVPAAWAFFLMGAIVWILRTSRRTPKVFLPILVGYGAIWVGTGIYVPFIIPATLIAIAFGVGFVCTAGSAPLRGVWARLLALKWIFVAGAAAAAVLGVWLVTRWATIQSFTSTVYPGERLEIVGSAGVAGLESLFGGVFSYGIGPIGGQPFGANTSEASTFLLPGLFLVVPAVWLITRGIRRREPGDWLLVALLAVGGVMFAFLLVPGWDLIAHWSLLDRTTVGRMRLGFGMLSFVLILVVVARLDGVRGSAARVPWWVPASAASIALGVNLAIAIHLFAIDSALVTNTRMWVLVAVLFVAVVWLISSGRATYGAASLVIIAVLCGATVNPIYRGVYDLNETELVQKMESITAEQDGVWIGVGDSVLPTVALVQSGLHSFNGFQSSPPKDMWGQIDPNGENEQIWNRLANVSWVAGEGAPAPSNPWPDQIRMTFDSCDAFAQANADYVLSDSDLDQACLTPIDKVSQGPSTLWIYEIVEPSTVG